MRSVCCNYLLIVINSGLPQVFALEVDGDLFFFAGPEASPTKAAGDRRLQCLLGYRV